MGGGGGDCPVGRGRRFSSDLKYSWFGLGSVTSGDSLLWEVSENETSILL